MTSILGKSDTVHKTHVENTLGGTSAVTRASRRRSLPPERSLRNTEAQGIPYLVVINIRNRRMAKQSTLKHL